VKKAICACLAAIAVAGCAAKPLTVGSITSIQPTNGATGTDVYANQRAAGIAVPEYSGDQLVEIRTYEHKDGEGGVEMADASCTVSAGTFKAAMTTPARVRVPLYKDKSESLAVQCTKPGFKPEMISLAAFDKTRADRYGNITSAGASAGLIGVVASVAIAGVIDASSDSTQNIWYYPPAKIVLERVEKSSS
jgi:hypothetical protein